MLEKLVNKGLAKKRLNGTVRCSACVWYSMLKDETIVYKFFVIIRGIVNYYSFINCRSDLWKVLAPLRKLCTLTFGFKHKIRGSAAKVFKKYEANLKITKLGKKVTRLFYPTSLKIKLNFKIKIVNL